jgi:hypothetical protein
MSMPKNDAEISLSRIKLVLNVPIKVKSDDFLVLGAEFNGYDYDNQSEQGFEIADLNHFYVIDINLAYVLKIDFEWRLVSVVTPRWSSNLTTTLEKEDFNLNLAAGVYRVRNEVEKPSRLVLGLSYNSSASVRVPLPVLYYERRFHPKWAFVLGVPKSGLKYYTRKQHFFQFEVILDGYYVNIQDNFLLADNSTASAISSTAVLATLGYQYKFTKDISVYATIGHSIFRSGLLRNENRAGVFTLNDRPGLYFRTGFRIGI